MCTATRLLVVAWIVGVVAVTVTGSEPAAWAAAIVAVALTHGLSRWGPARLRPATCAT